MLLCTFADGCKRAPRSPLSLARSSASPYCQDRTGSLGDTAEALSVCFENFFAKKDIEFTVVMLDSLQGEPVERVAGRLLERWGVGAENHGRGVLLLLALRERRARMEVSYALEPVLTDITCGRLIRDQIEPFLRQPGFLALALQGAAIFVSDRMNLEQDPVAREILRGWDREDGSLTGPALGGGAGSTEGFEFAVGAERKTLLSEAERRLYLADRDPLGTLRRYQDVLSRRITDPHLDVFTEGSQLFGESWPLATLDSARELARLTEARALRAEVLGRFAVVKTRPGDATSLPFFLVRGDDGLWRLDKVRNYRSIKVRHDGTFSLPVPTAYSYAYGASAEEVAPLQRAALAEERESLRTLIRELRERLGRSPRDPQLHFALADVYYDRCLAIPYAYELYEKGLALEPGDARLFLHAARRFDERKFAAKKALRCYERAYALDPGSREALSNTAILYSYFKDHAKARRYLRLALQRSPRDSSLMLYNAIELSRGGDNGEALEWLGRAVANGLPDQYVDYYERQTKTRVDRAVLGGRSSAATPRPQGLVEILSTRIGQESGWTTVSGRPTTVQFAEVTFEVHEPIPAGLAQAYAYLYDADKRLIRGCQARKVSRFFYGERSYDAGAAQGPRLDPGSHTIRFVWNDRGATLRYVVCVLGNGVAVAAQAASAEGVEPLEGFAFDEQALVGG